MFYRHYDPALGRMNALDSVAAKYSSLTPYNYAFNNPINWNDPMGDDPDDDEGGSRNHFSYDSWKSEYIAWRKGLGVSGDDDLYGYTGGYGYMVGHVTPGSGGHWADGMQYSDWSLRGGSQRYRDALAGGATDIGGNLYFGGHKLVENASGLGYYVSENYGEWDGNTSSTITIDGVTSTYLNPVTVSQRFVSLTQSSGGG